MAVFASHLNSLAVRAHEVGLHVEKVIQPKLAWVAQFLCGWREIGVFAVEVADRSYKMRIAVLGAEVLVALRTARC